MTKDYGRQSVSKKNKPSQHYLLMLLCFLLGYLTATFFKVEGLSRWANERLVSYQKNKPNLKKPPIRQAQQAQKPKFEFYTLLANEKTSTEGQREEPPKEQSKRLEAAAVSNPLPESLTNNRIAKVQAAVHPLTPSNNKGAFLIQVASFKARKDADQMKAILTLKAYEVTVTPVTNSNGLWYRVIVGPYANRQLAQKAQLVLSKSEHLNGMVRAAGG